MADPITVTDLENATLDVTTIAEVAMVGTTEDTVQNRDGDTLDTLQGRLNKLGFEPPIAYTSGITFTDSQDSAKTIEESLVIYGCMPSARPFTTTGDFLADSANFFIVQIAGTVSGNVRTDIDNTYDPGTTQKMPRLEVDDVMQIGTDSYPAFLTGSDSTRPAINHQANSGDYAVYRTFIENSDPILDYSAVSGLLGVRGDHCHVIQYKGGNYGDYGAINFRITDQNSPSNSGSMWLWRGTLSLSNSLSTADNADSVLLGNAIFSSVANFQSVCKSYLDNGILEGTQMYIRGQGMCYADQTNIRKISDDSIVI